MKEPEKFFSIGCKNCKGFQLGECSGIEYIPVFSTRQLAEMALPDWSDIHNRTEHPPIIIEIAASII